MFDGEGGAAKDFLVELWVVPVAAVEVISTGIRTTGFRIKIKRRPTLLLLLFSSSGWHEGHMAGLFPLLDNIFEDLGLP